VTVRVAYMVKRTGWKTFQESEGMSKRIAQLVRRNDPTVSRIRATHDHHEKTAKSIEAAFRSLGVEAHEIGPRTRDLHLDRYALVVTIGGDGTLLRASHKVSDVPVLGINSAPGTSVGFFCGVRDGDVRGAIEAALEGTLPRSVLTRMEVSIDGKVVSSRILNDALFCHQSPAATSRYLIEAKGVSEEHKSSGFWIGPAAGSTAAQRSAGGRVLPLQSSSLQLVVREPYTPKGERFALLRVVTKDDETIVVRSKMRDGALFLDGPAVCEKPRFGDVLTFRRSREPLTLLGIRPSRRR
jgi:NAD+ kinase